MKLLITESQYLYIKESNQYLDYLLDRISTKGMESLSPKEKRDLKRLSAGEEIDVEAEEEHTNLDELFMEIAPKQMVYGHDENEYIVRKVKHVDGGQVLQVTGPTVLSYLLISPFLDNDEEISIQVLPDLYFNFYYTIKGDIPNTKEKMKKFVHEFYTKTIPTIIRQLIIDREKL